MSKKYHEFSCRVYYEDTDLAGLVYYANYLKFIERARSEWLRELGIDQNQFKINEGKVFVVRKIEAEYLAAAKYDNVLLIQTRLMNCGPVRLIIDQDIYFKGKVIFQAIVTIVCLGLKGKVLRFPADIRRSMINY